MSYILSIETTTPLCSVALHKEGQLIFSCESQEDGVHGKKLTRLIEKTLNQSGIQLNQLSAIAISNGPGSYTGLRIGLATAKGLCFGLDLPIICLQTLEIMAAAWEGKSNNKLLLPMMDARRMEVYATILDPRDGSIVLNTAAVILEPDTFQVIDQQMIAFGNGAMKWRETCQHSKIEFSEAHPLPKARNMGMLAFKQFEKKAFAHIVTVEPNYLKEFMGTKPKSHQN
jgi:tRNA threonylcarbamoyladenosine biosynthesis protein TsaB